MDTSTIVLIVGAIIGLLGAFGIGWTIYVKKAKDIIDVPMTLLKALMDGKFTQEELDEFLKEWEEMIEVFKKK